jgi:hypothetical protein
MSVVVLGSRHGRALVAGAAGPPGDGLHGTALDELLLCGVYRLPCRPPNPLTLPHILVYGHWNHWAPEQGE